MANRTISDIAFDLWAADSTLVARLKLVAPEKHAAQGQGWHYESTSLDLSKREVVHTFRRGGGTRIWSFKPWSGGRPDFEPVLDLTVHTLRIKAAEAWRAADQCLRQTIERDGLVVAGRVGSPLAEPQTLPAAAWPFIEIDDWDAGTADSADIGPIYDLIESRPIEPNKPTSEKSNSRAVAARALKEMYPNGPPSSMPNSKLHDAVLKHFKASGIERSVSLDTVMRAAGRK